MCVGFLPKIMELYTAHTNYKVQFGIFIKYLIGTYTLYVWYFAGVVHPAPGSQVSHFSKLEQGMPLSCPLALSGE